MLTRRALDHTGGKTVSGGASMTPHLGHDACALFFIYYWLAQNNPPQNACRQATALLEVLLAIPAAELHTSLHCTFQENCMLT